MSSKFCLKIHLIFVIKYRKKILVGKLGEEVKSILQNSCTDKFTIEVMETDEDHVHMMINMIPSISVSSIVRRLKQISTNKLWKLCPRLLEKHFWKEHTFWSDGYFVCSIGNASEETIKNYIKNQ